MTDYRTALVRADTDPPTPTRRPRAARPCWQHMLAGGMLLGLFAMTIRAALHDQGAPGVWATLAAWAVIGGSAATDLYGRAHGYLPPLRRSDTWR